jgi:hypothetical protein
VSDLKSDTTRRPRAQTEAPTSEEAGTVSFREVVRLR